MARSISRSDFSWLCVTINEAGAPDSGTGPQAGAGGDAMNSAGSGGADNRAGSSGEPVAGGGTGGGSGTAGGGTGGGTGTAGGGTGGGVSGPQCPGVTMTQTATTGNGHSHITGEGQLNLKVWINGTPPTAEFELPATDHTHVIQLSQGQVDTLRSGGTITGVMSSESQAHTHAFAISCG